MKILQKVLAIIALLFLVPQTVRHAYMLWFEPRGSVLDRYDQPVKGQISEATSVDELTQRYEPLRRQADQAKQEQLKTDKTFSLEQHSDEEPFKSEHILREAITQWEERSKEIHELRFYWLMGLFTCLFGYFVHKRLNRWFGLTLLIVAFSEFIYWTSPSFAGGNREFDRLLMHKLIFSVISLGLLIAGIRLLGIFAEKQNTVNSSNT